MSKHSNTKARIEKKFSKNAKELLIALFPSLAGNEFSLESNSFNSYHGTVYHDEWVVWFGPDYYGESDYQDCEWLLYSWLIDNTTDWEGMGKAHDAVGWDPDIDVDESPFYSPWRGASRSEIISHCRDLARAGITLERMR
ncbi:hypothetical protein ACTJNB_22515 [Enterobacter hormaechei]|uniref:hypothetical protein n=1 Tax=Enterobacter cloacae complex TaxID=354276 RepID=UPI00079B9E93|nr:hypothetical protein [Enterobacter hormaechei]MBW7766172.1 hypothetical protein [Enterobacter hormaechei]MCW4736613.1 hypothetical protein [Enterobacter hormaechei subsp. xiangfangensis]CZW71700.1 Uncharacterised protein [Enterobacter hormaechei]CZW73397.1 Uncharacterised protein [Enterobacter hormaechei]VAC52164.1 Uncharacterised protein [Enterobacter hormaechei]